MKCLIKNKLSSSIRCIGLQGGLVEKTKKIPVQPIPEELDLNDCFFHAVGTYLPHHKLKNTFEKIINSKGILCDELLRAKYGMSRDYFESPSPKCNGDNAISICQKQSFLNPTETSESFSMYPKKHLSIILSKDILSTCQVENTLNPDSCWLDGELRVVNKVPMKNFLGIGVPCDTYLDMFTSLKSYGFSQKDCLDFIDTSYEASFLKIAEEVVEENDLEMPIYSIFSGKIMGNKYTSLNEVFSQEISTFNTQSL